MRKIIAVAAIFLSVSCSLIVLVPREKQQWDKVFERNVLIISRGKNQRYCNGVIIETNLVLTARHCLGGALAVRDKKARILKVGRGPFNDLALLSVETGIFPRLNLREPVFERIKQTGLNVSSTGELIEGRSSGMAIPFLGSYFLATVDCPKGHSGSGVYGEDNRLLGIITGGISKKGNAAISARKIEFFLGWDKKKIGS